MTTSVVSLQIQDIFDKNIVDDLKRFLSKRQCLNTANNYLIYLFHLVQSAGILTTSIAAGNNNTNMVWIGIGLNIFATLIHVYEKTNNSIIKKLMNDINKIKEGNYIDEDELIDIEVQKNEVQKNEVQKNEVQKNEVQKNEMQKNEMQKNEVQDKQPLLVKNSDAQI